jgi:chromosome segregation ATPase
MTSISFLASSLQPLPDPAREGLPNWIFWLLLSIILLLLFFIFLRDKDLRRRLSAFLSGAKRTMLRLRLQAKLRKERVKKSELLKELGRKAWSEDIQVEGTAEVWRRLKVLEEEKSARQMEWHEIYSQIEALGKRHEDVRKSQHEAVRAEEVLKKPFEDRMTELKGLEKDLKKQRAQAEKEIRDAGAGPRAAAKENAEAAGSTIDEQKDRLAGIGEEEARLEEEKATVQAELDARDRKIHEMELKHREEDQVREKGIREWEKKKETVQQRISELKKTSEPLYEGLGKTLDESRMEHKKLALCYSQIDGVNMAIQDLQTRIEKLQ